MDFPVQCLDGKPRAEKKCWFRLNQERKLSGFFFIFWGRKLEKTEFLVNSKCLVLVSFAFGVILAFFFSCGSVVKSGSGGAWESSFRNDPSMSLVFKMA